MKKYMLMLALMIQMFSVNSQTFEFGLQKKYGNQSIKKLMLKPEMTLSIGQLLIDDDSLKKNRYLNGTFISGTSDSLIIKLNEIRTFSLIKDAANEHSTVLKSPNVEALNPELMEVALTDIDFMLIKGSKKDISDEVFETLIWSSLFVLIASPFICYNYKAGYLDAERYKYWALGSTIGLVSGVGFIITINAIRGKRTFQFNKNWPVYDKRKTWEFTHG